MVDYHYRSRCVLKTERAARKFFFFFFIAILAFSWSNCRHHEGNRTDVLFSTENIPYSRWDDVFTGHKVISFTFPDPDGEIFSIGGILITTNGDYFVFDGKAMKVLHFDAGGKFIQYIGRVGEGPGEYGLAGSSYLDDNADLLIEDIYKRRINKYRFPDYQFETQFLLPTSIQDFLLDDQGNFIVYTTSEPNILVKVDQKGNTLAKALQVDRQNFRISSSRFQLGRLCQLPGDIFMVSYPEEYKIYVFDYQFNLKKTLYADSVSRYFPGKAVFPADLSPYDFSPKHAKWWGEALRPSMVLNIDKTLIAFVLAEIKNLSFKFYVNIHDLEGKTYAAGLEVPFDGIIRYAKDGFIYVVEESKFDESKNIIPLKLHRYKLKENI